jgi:hypothetical protein
MVELTNTGCYPNAARILRRADDELCNHAQVHLKMLADTWTTLGATIAGDH